MKWLRILWSRCIATFHENKLDAEFDDEVHAHIDLATEENLRRGMRKEDARKAALIAFGGVTQTRERYRTGRGLPYVGQLARDLRFTVRQLRKSPGFTAVAVATLALGIGAVASVFSVVNTVLLKPFPFRDPGRLVVMREVVEEARKQVPAWPFNYRHFVRLKKEAKTLDGAAIFSTPGESVSLSGDHPLLVKAVKASPNLFRVLGVQPVLGRDFADTDAQRGAPHVVVLSYAGWQGFYGGDPKVLGRTLRVGGEPATVVGVMSPKMRMPRIAMLPGAEDNATARETMVFEPMVPSAFDLKSDMGDFEYYVIARLAPGATLEQARAELETLQRAYTLSAHLPAHLGISLTPLAKDVTARVSGALWLMFAAVNAVLLIACVNLANLQLARAVSAERETAVRAALGASTAQLVIARLTESVVLASAGGLAGTALAFAGMRLFLALAPDNVPRLNEVQMSLPVLVFAVALSILAALCFGILPALFSLRVQPQAALQSHSSRTANAREGWRTRSTLIAAQVGCSLVLLIVTGLLLRSLWHLLHQDRGFDSSHVTLAEVDLYAPQYSDALHGVQAIKLAFADRALTALRQLPSVQSVALTSAMPMTGETWIDDLERPDHPVPVEQQPLVNARWINEDYLTAMQIPLIAGRNFITADRKNPYVALISEKTAHIAFAGENPLGKTISDILPNDQHALTVVGVVADAHINGLKDDSAMVYMPYWAFTPWAISFLVRSTQPSDALIPEIRRAVWNTDPQVAIPLAKSMDDQVGDSVAGDRFETAVLSSFGAAALLLALLGIYGVLSYSVSLRRQEFGIRIALGSGKAALMKLVLRQAAVPVGLGAAAGLGLTCLALPWIRSFLYEVPAVDPVAIGGSLLLILGLAALAAILPAKRATSMDPTQALRTE